MKPVYASLRERVMGDFEHCFNIAGTRTLRGSTELVDLSAFGHDDGALADATMGRIADTLDAAPRVRLFTDEQVASFSRVDGAHYDANLRGADPAGLYGPTLS